MMLDVENDQSVRWLRGAEAWKVKCGEGSRLQPRLACRLYLSITQRPEISFSSVAMLYAHQSAAVQDSGFTKHTGTLVESTGYSRWIKLVLS